MPGFEKLISTYRNQSSKQLVDIDHKEATMKQIPKSIFLLAALTLLTPFLNGCATRPAPPPGQNYLAEGFYILECDAFYEFGLVHVSPVKGEWHVNVLEGFAGYFTMSPSGKKPNEVQLVDADISYDELKRTIKGWAYIYPDNKIEGEATVWIKHSRHHRADRPFMMRPARR